LNDKKMEGRKSRATFPFIIFVRGFLIFAESLITKSAIGIRYEADMHRY
jgi:hypothetical protein